MATVSLTNVRGDVVTAGSLPEFNHYLRRGYAPSAGTVAEARAQFDPASATERLAIGATTRRAQFAWGCGGATIWSGNLHDAHQRLPIRLPVDTTRWRLRIGNQTPFGTKEPGVVSFTSVYVGTAAVDATTGAPTGQFASAPVQALEAFASPADGSDFVTDWVTAVPAQLAANDLQLVSMGWTKATTTNIRNGPGTMWFGTNDADAGSMTPAGFGPASNIAFAVAIEYEFTSGQRIGLALGDSLTEGQAAGGTLNLWHQRLSRRIGAPVALTAASGTTSGQWVSPSAPAWSRLENAGLTIDYAIVQLGVNDAFNSVTLAAYQANMRWIISRLRTTLGIRDIYLVNIAPRGATAGSAIENSRVALNTWLNAGPTEARAVFDVDAAVASGIAANTIRADADSGDGLHWSSVGQWRAAHAIRL